MTPSCTRPCGGTWGESIDVLAAAYKALGYDGAWREHYQGGPIGFEQREFELAPPLQRSPLLEPAAKYAKCGRLESEPSRRREDRRNVLTRRRHRITYLDPFVAND